MTSYSPSEHLCCAVADPCPKHTPTTEVQHAVRYTRLGRTVHDRTLQPLTYTEEQPSEARAVAELDARQAWQRQHPALCPEADAHLVKRTVTYTPWECVTPGGEA